MKKYVIIGNSTAAIGCVEGIRSVDTEGSITLIASEPHHTYSRPLISYLLYGKTTEELMKYRPDDFYEKNSVRTMLGVTVTGLDAEKKTVITETGETIPYDELLVATGSRPFVPPFQGLDTIAQKFSFMTLDDARSLEASLTPEAKVLVVGAGLIGLKCVEGILDRVGSVTVTDLADRILPSILDAEASRRVQGFLEDKGVKFLLSNSVETFGSNACKMKNGETVDYDIVVLAVGVRPNIALVQDAGGKTEKGILIDSNCKTSLENVYAAGDCAQGFAILPNAYMEGHAAGVNMAGGQETFSNPFPMNAIGFFGLHIITAGFYQGECYKAINEDTYKELFYEHNRLTGFILMGDVANAGIYTSLIRNKTPLDTIDFELIKEKPQLMAFTKTDRARKLAQPH